MGQTIFVTGGSGFIGRNLIPRMVAEGYNVYALARSSNSAQQVEALGAKAVRGDLHDAQALVAGMKNCDAVIHMAAQVADWGTYEEFYRDNVEGTRTVMQSAQDAGVRRFIHVSTEAVLMGGEPIVQADETWDYPPHPMGLYALTKGMAERLVREANRAEFTTVIVRPRLVWGQGDTTLLPRITEAVKTGRWIWIGGGKHKTSTCHVANTCEGILKALERGQGGAIYFLTDGEPVEFRRFVSDLLATQGLAEPQQAIPLGLAKVLASGIEWVWSTFRLKSAPPLNRTVVVQIGTEVTVQDAKARRELGYQAQMSIAEGLKAMQGNAS